MSTAAPTNSAIVTDYKAKTPGSGALYERARKVLPSGITHDARYLDPYSIHVAKAKGPRKWDVDGNEYVDYFGGHGVMLLGHSHPAIIEAVKKQIADAEAVVRNGPNNLRDAAAAAAEGA